MRFVSAALLSSAGCGCSLSNVYWFDSDNGDYCGKEAILPRSPFR